MKCNYCGAENEESSKFCSSCGAELTAKKKETKKKEEVKEEKKVEVKEEKKETKPVTATNKTTDGKATASLVLGICSFVIFCLMFPLSLIGLILGIVSHERSGKRTAGIVINALALAICVVAVILLYSFGSLVNFTTTSKVNKEIFKEIEEKAEKEIEKTEKEIEQKEKKNTQTIGDDYFGYVEVPKNWHKFIDVDGNSSLQYTDIGEYGYIITLDVITEDITPFQGAVNLNNHFKQEGNESSFSFAKLDNYSGYVVKTKYEKENKYLYCYLVKAEDGKVHYIAIEGPDKDSDSFDIPNTFKLEK